MPFYRYKNPKTGETVEVLQGMNDEHVFVDENGVKYNRVFSAPNMAMDTNIDPFSSRDFVEKTRKNGKVGDLWDLSKEMSEKRKEIAGKDEVRDKAEKKFYHGKTPPRKK